MTQTICRYGAVPVMNPTTEVSSSAKLEKTSAVLTRIHRIKRGNMENFILWSVSSDEKKSELSFFATAVNIQRINHGTQETIARMLNDLGSPEVSFERWIIDRFLTDYLIDYPLSDDWKDIWTETCEITVQLSKPINLKLKDTELIRTFARDTTWKGEPWQFPIKCVVVADFSTPASTAKAKQILELIAQLNERASSLDELRVQIPYVSEMMLTNFLKEYQEQRRLQAKGACEISVRQRPGLPQQLVVSVGVFDEQFFIKENNLAEWLLGLIHELDGTTTWEDTTDLESENLKRNPPTSDN